MTPQPTATPVRWTKPYHGVQHAGDYGTKTHWCTVIDYGSSATLHRWFPGCGFRPTESQHPDVESARAAGASWLDEVQS